MSGLMWTDGKGTLSDSGSEAVHNGLAVLQESVRANNFEKGWRSEDQAPRAVTEFVALIHSEVTEVLEAYRDGEPILWYQHEGRDWKWEGPQTLTDSETGEVTFGKPQGMASELADIIIRVLDMADELEIPVARAVLEKHAYNQTRSYRHGGKKA